MTEINTITADEEKLVELLNHNPLMFHNEIIDAEINDDKTVDITVRYYGDDIEA